MVHEYKSCEKCNGTGYLEVYKHKDNGICYSCWGTGDIYFYFNQNLVNTRFQELISNKDLNSKELEDLQSIEKLIEEYYFYNEEIKKTAAEEDESGIYFYDIKINEVITKLYNFRKGNNLYNEKLMEILKTKLAQNRF